MKIDLYLNLLGETEFITEEEIYFCYNKKVYIIEKGFRSDGASVPSFLWPIISPKIDGRTIVQSIIHDYLFQYKLGFWKSNFFYFKILKGSLSLFKRILILIRINIFPAG